MSKREEVKYMKGELLGGIDPSEFQQQRHHDPENGVETGRQLGYTLKNKDRDVLLDDVFDKFITSLSPEEQAEYEERMITLSEYYNGPGGS